MRDDWDIEFVPRLIPPNRVSLGAASALCRLARRAARDDGVAISVVVVDGGGAIIMAERMDSADTPSLEIAAEKARASARLGGPTASVEVPSLIPLKELVAVGGGMPLRHESALVGAIGVAGASPDFNHAIAARAAAVLGEILRPTISD